MNKKVAIGIVILIVAIFSVGSYAYVVSDTADVNEEYTTATVDNASDGFKGYEVGANVALAKNIVAAVKYYDLDAREGSDDEQTLWSEVVFTF